MNTYKRRIMFVISDQHFIPHGGIGQFAKGYAEMCSRLGWKLDVILDKAPTNDTFKKLFNDLNVNLIYPEDSVKEDRHDGIFKYSEHVGTFSFSDSVNLEKILNFRTSIMKAFRHNLYDMVVCNTQEAMTAAYILSLNKDMPVIFYTHLHSMIFRHNRGSDVFLECYHNFYNKHMEFPDIFIGTQSEKNKTELENYGAKFVSILPMPLSERSLLEPNFKERKGVLFIGRWEEGKNPEAYIKVMKSANLPCRVLTNENGKKKFEARFKEEGITDYEIKAGIIGEEKVEFIKGSKVFFMPSLRENYPFAFTECIGHMPCVVLDTQDWSDNFVELYFYKTPQADASDLIKALYSDMTPKKFYETKALDYVKMLDMLAETSWRDFLNGYSGRKATSDAAKINSETTVKYDKFMSKVMGKRKILSREDFESVLTNRHKFNVLYTDDNTWLSKDDNFVPSIEEENEGEPILKL